jgi:4-hydroxybenzoate polyprenyltransferase
MQALLRSTRVTLEMIKWEHSIFALPFALTGAILAARGWPSWRTLGLIVVCMVAARSAAMSFNRLVDAEFDATNPRTAMRAIPAGALTRRFAAVFTLVCCVVFVLGAAALNRTTLLLSPIALVVVLGYSFTKRFTSWSHVVLGLALGIAPAAAWIAVRGTLAPQVLVLVAAVLLWVGGFDVLYACQDVQHDTETGLHSIPRSLGLNVAFWVARAMHVGMLALLLWMVKLFALGPVALVGVAVVALLLAYEHAIVRPNDLRRMNAAFFLLNGVISVVYFLFIAADVLLHA